MTRPEALIWDDHYAVGIAEIDDEHRALFDEYNKIISDNAETTDPALVKAAVLMLEQYAERHFHNEERVMIECDYPHYQNHKMLHELFLANLVYLNGALAEGQDAYYELCRFFRTWLISHIMIRDAEVAVYAGHHAAPTD